MIKNLITLCWGRNIYCTDIVLKHYELVNLNETQNNVSPWNMMENNECFLVYILRKPTVYLFFLQKEEHLGTVILKCNTICAYETYQNT